MGAMTSAMAVSDDSVLEYAVAGKPLRGEFESGDLYAVIARPRGSLVAVSDGLGHGYEAAFASKLAINALTAQTHLSLPDLIKYCHQSLLRTRGVALSIASLDREEETMTWISVGNVAGLLLHVNEAGTLEREHIVMRSGVVGHRLPPLRSTTLGLHRGDLLVFATDGIREGFQTDVQPDARPQDAANRILARHGKSTDDALVLVARWRGGASANGAATR
jgi:phosphoserine phosphatase RsbX